MKAWDDFLVEIADQHDLAGAPRRWFLLRFSEENLNSEPAQFECVLAELQETREMNDPIGTFKTQMTEVYRKLSPSIPGIDDKYGKNKPEKVRKWLKEQYDAIYTSSSPVEEASSTADTLSPLQAACFKLLERQKRLTTNTLMAKDGITFQPDNLFVPLGLVQRQKRPKRGNIASSEEGSRLYEPTEEEITRQFEDQQEFIHQVIRDGDSPKSKGKRIAIIGEPGAGKTTLLQKIGDWLQNNDQIPIWISLANVGTKPLNQYLLEDWLRDAAGKLDAAPPEWKEALESLFDTDRVCLLLDGVDEMTVPNALRSLDEQLRSGWAQKLRVVMTCRVNVWETSALPEFDVYRNLNFTYPDQVEQFIDQFFNREEADSELGEGLKAELRKPGKERIQDSVKNPLRLSLLCYAWELGAGELPDTKAELYAQFVKAFYDLKQREFPITPDHQETLNRALGELAKEAIDQEDSRFLLRESFITRFLGNPDQEDSLFWQACRLGWLNQVGITAEKPYENAYAFLHPTFQEYFAALAIDDWHFFFNHVPQNPLLGTYKIFESQWEEVIILWIGQNSIDDKLKDDFLEAIMNFEDFCSGFYRYQIQILGGLFVSEFPTSKFLNEILENILHFGYGFFAEEERKWALFLEDIRNEAQKIIKKTGFLREKLIDYLIAVLLFLHGSLLPVEEWTEDLRLENDPENIFVYSIMELSSVTNAGQRIISLYEELLNYPHSNYIHEFIAVFLNRVDPGNPSAIEALVHLSVNEQRWDCINHLSEIRDGDLHIINTLILFILREDDSYACLQCAATLISICCSNPNAKSICSKSLNYNSQDQFKELLFKYILCRVRSELDEAVKTLISLAQDTEDLDVSSWAIFELYEIGENDLNAIDFLLNTLHKTQSRDNFIHALIGLQTTAKGCFKAIDRLVKFILYDKDNPLAGDTKIDDGMLISTVIVTLYNIITDDKDRERIFASLIDEIQDERKLFYLAKFLAINNPENSFDISRILELLRRTNDDEVRRLAIDFLEPRNGLTIETLNALLDETENKDSVQNTFDMLEDIESCDSEVAKILLNRFADDCINNLGADYDLIQILNDNLYELAIVKLKKNLTDEVRSDNFKLYACCHKVLWYCARSISYQRFLLAWNQAENSDFTINSSTSKHSKNYPFDKYFLPDSLKQVNSSKSNFLLSITPHFSDEHSVKAIAKQLWNRISQKVFPNEIPPKVEDVGDLERLLVELRIRLQVQSLAIIFYDCDPCPPLIDLCSQLADLIHIGWITDQAVPYFRTFHPNSSDLLGAIQSWLDELT